MTLQDIYIAFNDYKAVILLGILIAPWMALGICIAIPGEQEEPFVLNFNLAMAALTLLLMLGYLGYATHTGGWGRVIQEADILLLVAPLYYVGVSLWVSQQRLPLGKMPTVKIIQGLALIAVAYLGLSWFLSRLRILAITFIPFQIILLFILGLLGVAYLGYLRLTGSDLDVLRNSQKRSDSPPSRPTRGKSIDDELEDLRRQLRK